MKTLDSEHLLHNSVKISILITFIVNRVAVLMEGFGHFGLLEKLPLTLIPVLL